MAGARLVNYAPISISLDGMGLNVTAFSYAGSMWICAVSCREMLPDPSFFAQCLSSSFDLMKEAAAREAAFTVAELAALQPVDDEHTIEGKLARKPAKAARKKPTPTKRKPTTVSRRRARKTAPDSPA
jgi:diacylglycerol O-acyltransferase / wax synthase